MVTNSTMYVPLWQIKELSKIKVQNRFFILLEQDQVVNREKF